MVAVVQLMVKCDCMLQELAHEEVVRSVKLEQAKEVTKLRQEVEQGAKELASKYERKMKVNPHPPKPPAPITLMLVHFWPHVSLLTCCYLIPY